MIKVENLAKSYEGKQVFAGLNAEIDTGFSLITGRSGCGKTTFVRILAGLEKADEGEFNGISGNVTVMFQELRLFPSMTAIENLNAVVRKNIKQDAMELLSELGLTEDDAGKKPSELSGGMNQRVALARAILFDRYCGGNTVILDEPFSKLDKVSTRICAKAVKKYLSGKNVIIITHNEEECALLSPSVFSFDRLTTKK